MRRLVGNGDGDSGSAVVEFVLVSVLVVTLAVAVIQVGISLHIRNTLVAAAGEGARFAAAADQSPAAGAAHTESLIRESLPDSLASDVTASTERVAGVETIRVTVTTELPLVGWLGPAQSLRVSGHAMDE